MRTAIWKCALVGLVIGMLVVPLVRDVPTRASIPPVKPIPLESWDESYLWANGYIQEGAIRVILQYTDSQSLQKVQVILSQINGEICTQFQLMHFLAVKVPYNQLASLKGVPLFLDRKVTACLDNSVPLIKPASQWAQIEAFFGYTINGSGVRVAVLDTGIETAHPDLDDLDDNGTTTDPKVILEKSFVLGNTNPEDDNGHGTHVAGIISGTGWDSLPLKDKKGVAPGCWLLNGKVLDAAGEGYESWVMEGIEWALNNSADVINLSLATLISGNGTDPLSLYVDYAVSQGVPVVLAAGKTAGPYRIAVPGVARDAITVGASDGATMMSTSPNGPTYDFRIKPDLLAPGKNIDSCDSDASGYTPMTGTSQAAAHVTGTVALLRQVHPTWTPAQIKAALMTTATNLNLDPYQQGGGRVYIPTAINSSLWMDPTADFRLLNPDKVASRVLTIRNLRPYAVELSYISQKYTLNLTNPIMILGQQSLTVNISITPSTFTDFRIFEYVNFTVEGKALHLIASGIKPNLTLTSSATTVLYNTSFTLYSTLAFDKYPITFLNHSYIELKVNSTMYQRMTITGNGSFATEIRNSTLTRGCYRWTAQVYIENTFLLERQLEVTIFGYGSALTVQNVTAKRRGIVTIPLQSYQNVSGACSLFIFREGDWELLDTITTPTDQFSFQTNFHPGTYQLKVVFEGNGLYEPCEARLTLTLEPDYAPLFLTLGIMAMAIALSVTSLLLYHNHHQKVLAKAERLRQIKAENERLRDEKYRRRMGIKGTPMAPLEEPPTSSLGPTRLAKVGAWLRVFWWFPLLLLTTIGIFIVLEYWWIFLVLGIIIGVSAILQEVQRSRPQPPKHQVQELRKKLVPAPLVHSAEAGEADTAALQAIIKTAQTYLAQNLVHEAAQAYQEAAALATTLEKPEMARIYAAKAEELHQRGKPKKQEKPRRTATDLPSREENKAIKNEIGKLQRLAREALRDKEAKVAAKYYQKIADLYETLHDEENAREFRRRAEGR